MMLDTAPVYLKERMAQVARERSSLDFGKLPPDDIMTAGMPARWCLIENDWVLYCRSGRGVPLYVWSPKEQVFAPNIDSCVKPIEWGYVIGTAEAQRLINYRSSH